MLTIPFKIRRRRKPGPNASMAERATYIRAKYENRSYYGHPTKETLRAAAAECEMRLDQLPAGYLEGVNHLEGEPTAAAASSYNSSSASMASGSSESDGGKLNPAVARRLAKKREEEEAERRRQGIVEAAATSAAQASMGESE